MDLRFVAACACLLGFGQFFTDAPRVDPPKPHQPTDLEIVGIERNFVKKMQIFHTASRSMPANVAAKGWLGLIQEGHDIPKRTWVGGLAGGMSFGPGSAVSVFGVIPGPDVWPEIERQIAKRPEGDVKNAFQALFARMRGDEHELTRIENSAPALFGPNRRGLDVVADDTDQHQAQFLDLLRHNRIDELVKDIDDWHDVPVLPGNDADFRGNPALLSSLYKPISDLAGRTTNHWIWIDAIQAAISSGHAKEMALQAKKILVDPNADQKLKDVLYVYLPRLDGVSGVVDRVRGDYQWLLERSHGSWASDNVDETLLNVGIATDDRATIEQGIRVRFDDKLNYDHAAALEAAVQYRPAQEALAYAKTLTGDSSEGDFAETQMCAVYRKENRPDEILKLLGNNDSPIIADAFDDRERAPTPAYYLAWAYSQTGKRDLAVRILHYMLPRSDTCVAAYQLLNRLEGARALPLYGDLRRLDPISPFPLVWQADLLLYLGRSREAEPLLRKAVALDPTDRLSLPEHRFTAYHLLAPLVWKAGSYAEAAKLDNIAESAMYLERADRFFKVNLVPQAMVTYQNAERQNPDSYVIEEQLALCLERLGRWREAVPLHRRAFQLFAIHSGPATYGEWMANRMFEATDLIPLGIQVFTKFEEAGKGTAGSAFGLGCLYGRGKPALALRWYEKAVTRDPDCLAAWVAISLLERSVKLTQSLASASCLHTLALSPVMQGPSPYPCFGSVYDLRPLFRSIQRLEASYPPVALNPLPQPTDSASEVRIPAPAPWLHRPYGVNCPVGAYFVPAPDIMSLLTAIDSSMGTSVYSNIP